MLNDKTLANMEKTLNVAIVAKNTITTTQFKKFLPLFQKNKLGEEQLKSLAMEYQRTISLFHSVTIVDEHGETKMVLPPMFNNIDTINNHDSSDPTLTLRAFVNAVNRDSHLTTDKERSTHNFIRAIKSTQNKERLLKNYIEYEHLADNINKTEVVDEELGDDWDWD